MRAGNRVERLALEEQSRLRSTYQAERRRRAESMLREGLTYDVISERLGLRHSTIRQWKRELEAGHAA